MSTAPLRTRRWTRVEYDQLVQRGVFDAGERIELIGGHLAVREPQGSKHAAAIDLALDALRAAFGPGWRVRVQLPIALDDESEPEPDLAVVPGSARDYVTAHPARPVLIVEVAETSLAVDREHKGSLYARAGIGDYWIVNLADQLVEVYREPASDASATYGWRYAEVTPVGSGGYLVPLASRDVRIAVGDLLP